tara:strand:- start:440 stop:1828 length:1389 start_codon:yes stop_codon:yes gene_type:complete
MYTDRLDSEKALREMVAKAKSAVPKILGSVVLLVLILTSFGYNDSGMSTRVQTPLLGHTWINEEGFYGKVPLLSRVRSYVKDITIAVTDNESTMETASIVEPPRILQFADTYKIRTEYSMRFRIPTLDEDLEKMHQSVKSFDNLVGNTLMPFALTLANDTANQLLAQDFAQGGKNQFRNRMVDQAENGMRSTIVREEPITVQTADTSSDRDPGQTKQTTQYIKKVVSLTNPDGSLVRIPTAISSYNITLVPNSLNVMEAVPVDRLVEFIDTKQKNLALQVGQQEEQVLERGKAKTMQLTGARELIEKTNILNIAKAEAIIAAEQRVEEANLQAEKEVIEKQKIADLAVIDKTRELQIATANEGIQRANDTAASFEASAIKKVGFAEAAVANAHLKAKQDNSSIYMAELKLQEVQAFTSVLPKVSLNMPANLTVIGEQNAGNTGLDTNLMNLGMLKSALGVSK